MSLGKKDISQILSTKAQISLNQSNSFLKKFLEIIILKADSSVVKIAKFGTFEMNITPRRLGRNPQTKEEYVITKRSKISFKPSNFIKKIIN